MKKLFFFLFLLCPPLRRLFFLDGAPEAKQERKVTTYDSRADTLDHIGKVADRIFQFNSRMKARAHIHDASKLEEPEKSLFDKYTPLLRETTYGSDEYKAYLAEMGQALQHHYAVNSHHPEHFPVPETEKIKQIKWDMLFIENCPALNEETRASVLLHLGERLAELESRINGMSLLDVVEMFCDWKAASERHANGDFMTSLILNRARFGLSDQLYQIFVKTAKELYEVQP